MGTFGYNEPRLWKLEMYQKLIELIKSRFRIETEIIDSEEELSLVVINIFNNEVIYKHKQDLIPLFWAFKKRLEDEDA